MMDSRVHGAWCIACAVLKDLVQALWDHLCKYPMRDDMYGDVVKVLGCLPAASPCIESLPPTDVGAERVLCLLLCPHFVDTLNPSPTCAQMTKYLVFYPDVPSFIASIQKRHDSLLDNIDTSEPEGAALRVRPRCTRRAHPATFLHILAQRRVLTAHMPATQVRMRGSVAGQHAPTPHAPHGCHLQAPYGAGLPHRHVLSLSMLGAGWPGAGTEVHAVSGRDLPSVHKLQGRVPCRQPDSAVGASAAC